MKTGKFWVYTAIVTSMVFWSMSFVWYKEIYQYLKPITTIFLRLVISSSILLLATFLMRRLQKIEKADIKLILILAFFEPLLYFLGESFGMMYVSPTLGSVIISTIPLFVPIAALYFFKERLNWLNLSGIILSTIGVCFVLFDSNFEITASFTGVLLLFLAVASAVFYSIILMKATTKYNTLTIITYQNTIGVFYFMPLFFIFEYDHFKTVEFTMDVLTPLFEMAVFASSLAFLFFTYGMRQIGISKANIFANLIPVFTAIFAFWLYGEELYFQKVIGILVVMGGLFMSQFRRRPKKPIPVRNE